MGPWDPPADFGEYRYAHVYTHVYNHAYAHAYTHAYTHVYTHAYAHVCTRSYRQLGEYRYKCLPARV